MLPDTFLKESNQWRCNHCKGEATQETVMRLLTERAKKWNETSRQDAKELEDYIAQTMK